MASAKRDPDQSRRADQPVHLCRLAGPWQLLNKHRLHEQKKKNLSAPLPLVLMSRGSVSGGLGEAKVSCVLRHRGVHLRLAYLLSLRQVRLEEHCFYFICFFTFIHFALSPLSLSFISSTISSISFLPFSGRRYKMTHKD